MWRRYLQQHAWGNTSTRRIWRVQRWPGVWQGRAILSLVLLLGIGSLSAAWGQLPGRPARRPGGPPPPNAAAAVAAPPSRPAKISLENNQLSVQAQDSDLRELLEKITTQAQIEVRHLDSLADRRVSVDFTALPMVDGLKRILRAAEVAGYALVTTPSGDEERARRLVFLKGAEGAEGPRRTTPTAAAIPGPAGARRPPPPPQPQPTQENRPAQQEQQKEEESEDQQSSATVFEDLKANATARRLLNQLIHPNEQVRERALEGIVRLIREDDKQRDLLEFLEPLMEDLSAEDKDTQEEAREEIRQLLR